MRVAKGLLFAVVAAGLGGLLLFSAVIDVALLFVSGFAVSTLVWLYAGCAGITGIAAGLLYFTQPDAGSDGKA